MELISYPSYSGSFSSATSLPVGESLIYSSTSLDIARTPTWQSPTQVGDWNVASNWSGGIVPNSAGAHAVFNNSTGSAELAATVVPISLGILDIIGSNGTTITGAQGVGLTMQTSDSSTAQINVSGGTTHEINLSLTFASNGAVSVASGSTLEIGNPVSVNANQTLNLSGAVQLDSWLYLGAARASRTTASSRVQATCC